MATKPHKHDMLCPANCAETVQRTELERAIRKGESFGGAIVGVHRIGEYAILEYIDRDYHHGENYGKLTGLHNFAPYINERCISMSWHSLDAALVGVIAYKRDGCNSQAARLFIKATTPNDGGDCDPETRRHYYNEEARR